MRQVKQPILVFVVFSVLCGLIYPLFMTAISQFLFPWKSNGSIITSANEILGSELIGQKFDGPKYFHGRPSETDPAYNASASTGSNLGPSNAKWIEAVKKRVGRVRHENRLPPQAAIPADLVLVSASGLDPHISVESAMLQVKRIARERGLSEAKVEEIVRQSVELRLLGIWGQPRVNVLKLNLAMDQLKGE
ncbi:MAG: potassium-transporting ATPase subunit KdpC [Syntrophaceae bacterium]|nr:potassium-transporting ATPase subunit KdpC [Syntrophaceae bacterium]